MEARQCLPRQCCTDSQALAHDVPTQKHGPDEGTLWRNEGEHTKGVVNRTFGGVGCAHRNSSQAESLESVVCYSSLLKWISRQ